MGSSRSSSWRTDRSARPGDFGPANSHQAGAVDVRRERHGSAGSVKLSAGGRPGQDGLQHPAPGRVDQPAPHPSQPQGRQTRTPAPSRNVLRPPRHRLRPARCLATDWQPRNRPPNSSLPTSSGEAASCSGTGSHATPYDSVPRATLPASPSRRARASSRATSTARPPSDRGTAEPRSASSAPCSFSDHDLGGPRCR